MIMTTRIRLCGFTACLLLLSTALADSLWLVCDPPTDGTTIGYIAVYGSGGSTNTVTFSTANVNVTNRLTGQVFIGPGVKLTNLVAGVTYGGYLIATNADALQSIPSTVVVWTLPKAPAKAALVQP